MSEIKELLKNYDYIYSPNGGKVLIDKENGELIINDKEKKGGKYTQQYSKALLDAWQIMESSPYKDYKPLYLDPELKTGESSTYLEFKAWQELYLKEPQKGAIAPWTKAEKAYYQSLKTKRERYKYLVIRSGLRSSIIDIPYDAYCNVDENGKLIKEEYKELYAKVEANRGTANMHKGWLHMAEWELSAGILGDIEGFVGALQLSMTGFKARTQAVNFLLIQLGHKDSFKDLYDSYQTRGLVDGLHKNPIKAQMLENFAKNAPYDEFGMLPYLDELIGVDWVMDFNNYRFAYDGSGNAVRALHGEIKQGKLKDPRDVDSTPESRLEFEQESVNYKESYKKDYSLEVSNDTPEQSANNWLDNMLLEAKIKAITPPQGYPNAPHYYTPERLELIYKKHALDKKLNPTIPAIYRYNFPESLRVKIKTYAKEHNIKE